MQGGVVVERNLKIPAGMKLDMKKVTTILSEKTVGR